MRPEQHEVVHAESWELIRLTSGRIGVSIEPLGERSTPLRIWDLRRTKAGLEAVVEEVVGAENLGLLVVGVEEDISFWWYEWWG